MIVHHFGGQQAEGRVVVFGVVPGGKALAEGAGVLDRAEAVGELGTVLEGFELAFGEGVVVGDARAAVALGDAEVGQEKGQGLGLHRGSPIGLQGELSGLDALFGGRLLDQALGQGRAFARGHHPADDVAAEDVENDVEVEVGPLGRPEQFGDVPRPDLVGAGGQELGFRVTGMAQLVAPLAHLAVGFEDAVHGAHRAEVDALVEERGVDLARGFVDETGAVERVEDRLTLGGRLNARCEGAAALAGGVSLPAPTAVASSRGCALPRR